MGDIMLLGVLRMPFDTKGDLHLVQLQQRCLQAADRIEADTKRLKEAKDLFESITCHRAEGVEFFSTTEILDAICKDAMKGYHICEEAAP